MDPAIREMHSESKRHWNCHKGMCWLCRALCAELAPSSQRIIDSFGIPSHLVAAPIAVDWEKYNKVDNQGELIGPAFD